MLDGLLVFYALEAPEYVDCVNHFTSGWNATNPVPLVQNHSARYFDMYTQNSQDGENCVTACAASSAFATTSHVQLHRGGAHLSTPRFISQYTFYSILLVHLKRATKCHYVERAPGLTSLHRGCRYVAFYGCEVMETDIFRSLKFVTSKFNYTKAGSYSSDLYCLLMSNWWVNMCLAASNGFIDFNATAAKLFCC